MKKIVKSIFVVSVVLCLVVVLSGCGKSSKGIVGSWAHDSYVYTFNSDKTGNYDISGSKMEFTYEDDGKKVSILFKGNTVASDFEYRIDGNKLIIKDSFGNDVEYIKK